MPNIIDELCPSYTGEKRISLQLSEDSRSPRAFVPISIAVDYSACEPEGVCFPLELTIIAPTASDFRRVIYQRAAPSTISFQPREGGLHAVRFGEVGHNRWFGFLEINVAGESASALTVT
jgi:hypothetical protein